MRYMNYWDLDNARSRFTEATCPNRLALVMMVDHLREWTDNHGDGWAYWGAPVKAARPAIDHIYSTTNDENRKQEENDITDAQMLAAVTPIKSFLTRHKATVEEKEIIFRSVVDATTP